MQSSERARQVRGGNQMYWNLRSQAIVDAAEEAVRRQFPDYFR